MRMLTSVGRMRRYVRVCVSIALHRVKDAHDDQLLCSGV